MEFTRFVAHATVKTGEKRISTYASQDTAPGAMPTAFCVRVSGAGYAGFSEAQAEGLSRRAGSPGEGPHRLRPRLAVWCSPGAPGLQSRNEKKAVHARWPRSRQVPK